MPKVGFEDYLTAARGVLGTGAMDSDDAEGAELPPVDDPSRRGVHGAAPGPGASDAHSRKSVRSASKASREPAWLPRGRLFVTIL